MNPSRPIDPRRGSTLVEAMVASLLLAVLAVGGAAFITHARTDVLEGRSGRVALNEADRRLEELRTTPFGAVKPPVEDYNTYYVLATNETWLVSATDPGETVTVNSLDLPITTTVQYVDIDGGADSYDVLLATVGVGIRPTLQDRVVLETYLAP